MKKLVGGALLLAILAAQAQGHFVFLKPARGGCAEAVFSDNLEPDSEDLLARIKHTQFALQGGKELKAEPAGAVLRTASTGTKPAWVVGVCPYGVVAKGKVPFKLTYYARTVVNGTPADLPSQNVKELLLDVTPILKDGKVVAARVSWKGKPLANAELLHLPPNSKGEWITHKTDARGEATISGSIAGLHALRARHTVKTRGRSSGKRYDEERSYATLTYAAK